MRRQEGGWVKTETNWRREKTEKREKNGKKETTEEVVKSSIQDEEVQKGGRPKSDMCVSVQPMVR